MNINVIHTSTPWYDLLTGNPGLASEMLILKIENVEFWCRYITLRLSDILINKTSPDFLNLCYKSSCRHLELPLQQLFHSQESSQAGGRLTWSDSRWLWCMQSGDPGAAQPGCSAPGRVHCSPVCFQGASPPISWGDTGEPGPTGQCGALPGYELPSLQCRLRGRAGSCAWRGKQPLLWHRIHGTGIL